MGDLYENSRSYGEEKLQDYVHVFQVVEKTAMQEEVRNWRQKFWQVFPTFCASLTMVPFGIMLGWPSTTYPYLLQPTSDIPITYSQSAMTAGFLMLGLSTATPFSSKYHLGPKYGIFTGLVFVTVGWIIMWYSKNIFWLLASRFVVGLGSGYGTGQIKNYIKDMCEPATAQTIMKQLNFHAFIGVIIAYTTGIFLDFRKFPLVPMVFCLVLLFLIMFLPCTPKDFIRSKKMDEAVILLDFLRGKRDHSGEIEKIQNELVGKNRDFFIPIMKNKDLRPSFLKFVILVLLQQFSGGATSIIYCQIIFEKSGCPYPEYCAVLYSIVFFTSNIYGVFYSPNFNKKYVMVFSSIASSILLLAQILVLYFEINRYSNITSFIILILFIASYSKGMGNIPVTLIGEWFPVEYRQGISDLFVIEFYMSALVATKIFQVLFTAYSLYVGFSMFFLVDLFFLGFVLVFIPNKPRNTESFIQANKVYFMNESMKHIDKISTTG